MLSLLGSVLTQAMSANGKWEQPFSDEEIKNYENEVLESEKTQPMIGKCVLLEDLREEYRNSLPIFQTKLESLVEKFKFYRPVKKDGNCFFRAIGFRVAELCRERAGSVWAGCLVSRLTMAKDLCYAAGYSDMAVDDFWELTMDACNPGHSSEEGQNAGQPNTSSASEKVLSIFNNEYVSDGIICFLRILIGATLKINRDIYEPFVLDVAPTLDDFVATKVDIPNVEADHIHIIALVNALGLNCTVADFDSSETVSKQINYHEFAPMESLPSQDDEVTPAIVLLYRPGHYEILYESDYTGASL